MPRHKARKSARLCDVAQTDSPAVGKIGAERVFRFLDKYIVYVEGDKAGQKFVPEAWERKVVQDVYGDLMPDGTRRVREALVSMGRKNGKSTFLAALALFHLFAEGEHGAQVIIASGTREQAAVMGDTCLAMVEMNPTLRARAQCSRFQKTIRIASTNSRLRVVAAESAHLHGLGGSAIFIDEVAQIPRDLYSVLKTSQGARRNPILFSIGTAGHDRHGLMFSLYEHAKRVLSGTVRDETFYTCLYEANPEDDWQAKETWARANPSLGTVRALRELEESFTRALAIPAQEASFKNLYLNLWLSAETKWLSLIDWDKCDIANWVTSNALESPTARPGASQWPYLGRIAFAGLDYGSSRDLSALVLAIPDDGTVFLLPRFWMPTANLDDRCRQDKVPYDRWIKQGLITACDGPTVEVAVIEDELLELREKFDLREIAYDPWNLRDLGQRLLSQGFPMVEFPQNMAHYTQPTKDFEKRVVSHTLRHDGNEVLRWMVDCCTVRPDSSGNIKPVKPDRQKDSRRIDGVVASIMALDRLNANSAKPDLEAVLKRGPITFQL